MDIVHHSRIIIDGKVREIDVMRTKLDRIVTGLKRGNAQAKIAYGTELQKDAKTITRLENELRKTPNVLNILPLLLLPRKQD